MCCRPRPSSSGCRSGARPTTKEPTAMRKPLFASVALAATAPLLMSCTENASDPASAGGNPRAVSVDSGDDACEVSADSAPAGTLTFDVTNSGGDVTEFYLLGEDGL